MSPRRTVVIEGQNIRWIAYYGHRAHVWIAACDELGLTVEADDFEDLGGLIAEAMNALLSDLIENEEGFHKFLRARGWHLVGEQAIGDPRAADFAFPHAIVPMANPPVEQCRRAWA